MCIQECINEHMYIISKVWLSLNAKFSRGVSLSKEKCIHKCSDPFTIHTLK